VRPAPLAGHAADRLLGLEVPALVLESSQGPVDLHELCASCAVVFVYPRTATPGVPQPDGWNAIPGAAGCTAESCAFRDRVDEFSGLGIRLAGLSMQSLAEQVEFAGRNRVPFPVIADPQMRLADALRLPTFEVDGRVPYKRLTWVASGGRIVKVFYPVFPPEDQADEVLQWLARR
jgi:peroxiredoxin